MTLTNSKQKDMKQHGLGGALGGFIACVALQPFDVRLQQSKSNDKRIIPLIQSIVKNESVKALWRGTIATIYRNVPGSAMYFITLDKTKTFLKKHDGILKNESVGGLVAGSFSRALVGFIFMPISVIKVRFESNLYQYKHITEAIRSIYAKEGLFGFFAGYGATAMRDAPYAGLYVFVYDQLKTISYRIFYNQETNDTISTFLRVSGSKNHNTSSLPSENDTLNHSLYLNHHVPVVYVNATCGMFAGLIATSMVHPFDVLKTRIQLSPLEYKNMFFGASMILKNEGIKGLFAGYVPRVARRTLSAAITWTVYEEIIKK